MTRSCASSASVGILCTRALGSATLLFRNSSWRNAASPASSSRIDSATPRNTAGNIPSRRAASRSKGRRVLSISASQKNSGWESLIWLRKSSTSPGRLSTSCRGVVPQSTMRVHISPQCALPFTRKSSRVTRSDTSGTVTQSEMSTFMRCQTTLAVGINSTTLRRPSSSVTRFTPRGPVSLMSRPWIQPENARRGFSSV